jgi:hypothetical protein
MILIFKNNNYELNTSPSDFGLTDSSFADATTDISSFFIKTSETGVTCAYPQNIKNLFPRWIRVSNNDNSVLISLTEQYYQWLSCESSTTINGITGITEVKFLSLEDLTNIDNIPGELLSNLANCYINAIPKQSISDGLISETGLKNLIKNVKTNLYAKKGTEESIKLVINKGFDIPVENISIGYPKKYIFRLNGGNFDWMRDNLDSVAEYVPTIHPQLTGSRLNFSVISDGDIWQSYSYVVNCSALSEVEYIGVVRPATHPSGFKDLFNYKPNIFNNTNNSNSGITIVEIPKIQNYGGYTLGSSQTIGYTFGCASAFASPYYLFPSWDYEISNYPAGSTFGVIILSDFFELTPLPGYTFPNETLTCDT